MLAKVHRTLQCQRVQDMLESAQLKDRPSNIAKEVIGRDLYL